MKTQSSNALLIFLLLLLISGNCWGRQLSRDDGSVLAFCWKTTIEMGECIYDRCQMECERMLGTAAVADCRLATIICDCYLQC
ncbi:unnamed protein product [Linum tenue]|uniref:Uncharacterized protein n=1 Tax=Linum tenue TaxID=586396 RepID=A0AAV0KUJ6_9ROSI|nr:unnamed protein product [Linum tenue]CAI0449509.1 unnamed protein product [Linum tenue]